MKTDSLSMSRIRTTHENLDAVYLVILTAAEHYITQSFRSDSPDYMTYEDPDRPGQIYYSHRVPERTIVLGPYTSLPVARGIAKRRAYRADSLRARKPWNHFNNRQDDVVVFRKAELAWEDV